MTKLQEIRKASGLSQSALAEASGVSIRMIQKYEIAERDINKASAISIYCLAEALKCDIKDILDIR